jgi:hypothetical protein
MIPIRDYIEKHFALFLAIVKFDDLKKTKEKLNVHVIARELDLISWFQWLRQIPTIARNS